MMKRDNDKVCWVGIYNIGDDSFTVWQALLRDKSGGRALLWFTEKEVEAIEKAAEARVFFKWNPPDSDLTSGSRADWARM